MHLRAAGENPAAAASVGIPVQRTRFLALMLSGLFAGLGGIHMSMGYLELFQRDMTGGRGFIALATPLLGGNTPVGTMGASVVFGFFDALANRVGTLQVPSQLPQSISFVATVMALVIYALQARLTLRVRALRAAEGEGFNAGYWRSIQRLSVLHIIMAMVAVIGILISISMFAAPNGFGGEAAAYPVAGLLALVALVLIAVNLPFLLRVERIGQQVYASAGATLICGAVYLGLFFSLFFSPVPALAAGLVAGLLAWLALGGWQLPLLSRASRPATA
jgi:predicted ABC-type sugar transport system permease subunit